MKTDIRQTEFLNTIQQSTGTATNQQDSPGIRFMPPSALFYCLLTGGVMEFFVPSTFGTNWLYVRLALGLFTVIAGFLALMLAHGRFMKLGTSERPDTAAKCLVSRGLFRFSRNPMYFGGMFFFIGIGMLVGSLWLLGAAVPLFLYLRFYVISKEESYMLRAFGDEYRSYCKKVRRWI